MYSIFSFPVNLVLFLLWGLSVVLMWSSRRKSGFVRFMLSSGATYLAVGIFLVICLVIGITGCRWITTTWPFVIFMLYFQSVLAYVILRGWREATATGARLGAVRWRFLFLHAGLLVTIGFAYWGAPDTATYRMQAFKDVPVYEAYDDDGNVKWLDYSLTLEDFTVSYGADGIPSDYRAVVSVDGEKTELRVNHPCYLGFGEDLYLTSYDTSAGEYCVLQVVREPWRYGALVGIVMMLIGAFMLFVGGPRRNNNIID
ncbi:MAG: cytochrome c biogenesis protein ResB [Bacteroidales bacterium]|nr:cytochrome c biogenesis protein ResB [Bacteroidales bacterium]